MADESIIPATGANDTDTAPLGDGGKKALESERRARRDAEARARTAESAFSDLVAERRRETVAASKGVPAELLTGESEEELSASADALLAFRSPTPDPGARYGRPKEQLTPDPGAHIGPVEPDLGSLADQIRQ